MTNREQIGRLLLTVAILATPGFQVTADWSFGHISNPDWPPHAKYHLIVYHLTLIELSLVFVTCCWLSTRFQPFGLRLALFSTIAFWIPYYVAGLFPMASVYATSDLAKRGIPAQFVVGAMLMLMALVGYPMARRTTDAHA